MFLISMHSSDNILRNYPYFECKMSRGIQEWSIIPFLKYSKNSKIWVWNLGHYSHEIESVKRCEQEGHSWPRVWSENYLQLDRKGRVDSQ